MAKLVSQAWKDLSDEGRSEWLELGRIDRERYEREKAAYRGPWKVPDVKDPSTPKRPMSAFLAFSNERRKTIVAQNPHLSGRDISSLLSKLWKECPSELKRTYREREAHERALYKKARAAWKQQTTTSTALSSSSSSSLFEPATVAMLAVVDDTSSSSSLSSSSSVMKSEDALSEKDPLDMDDFDDLMADTDAAFEKDKAFLSALDALCPWDIQQPQTDNIHPMKEPTNFAPATRTALSCEILQHQPEKIAFHKRENRFENYTMEDILKDDELFFEDFSPSQVKSVPILSSSSSSSSSSVCYYYPGTKSEAHCPLPRVGSLSALFSW